MSRNLIVIPTYNEKENIKRLLERIHDHVPETDVLIVDDSSPDGTSQIVAELSQSDNRINLITRPGKNGLGTAYCKGFAWGIEQGYDTIMEMDADFSHDPKEIPRFLEEIKTNDLVIGSRYIKGVNVVNWPLSRLLLSYFANMYTKFVTGLPIKDATGGFKCFRASKLAEIDLSKIKTNGYGFQIEMNHRMWKKKARIKEIPIVFVDRIEGESKMNKKIIYEAVFLVWKLKFGIVK
ncbi:MAG: polyprenol monophosphomannose synthase [Candidatus Kapaibacteriales bacterium]